MKRLPALSSPSIRRTLTAFALGLCAAVLPGVARASQSFPGAIQEHLMKTGDAPPCPVSCTLCHTSPAGGVATVRAEGFTDNLRGQSAVAFNNRNRMPPGALTAGDATTVGPALDALEKLDCAAMPGKVCDSDGDGFPDIQELRAGTNPDGPGDLGECPMYGCGASSIAPSAARPREVQGAWLLAALGVLVLARRRR
jgi:MYXO-CTERM domain-containing protein